MEGGFFSTQGVMAILKFTSWMPTGEILGTLPEVVPQSTSRSGRRMEGGFFTHFTLAIGKFTS
jgi:hypothetical protein